MEQFFLARLPEERPPLACGGLLPDERVNLYDHRWVTPSDLTALPDRLEPSRLAAVIAAILRP